MDASTIYLLPGLHGRLGAGLGAELLRRGWPVTGRETVGEFHQLPFAEQVLTIAQDLKEQFWRPEARVIANSFGAYLFMNAQALLPPFPGRVLLLSALLGEGIDPNTGIGFVSPRSDKLNQQLDGPGFPVPAALEVHVGENDWQASPGRWQALGERLDFHVHLIPGADHMLDHGYVGSVLDYWFG
jgi:hypothetical protein